ncbi:hypothetical protein [Streptomyces sp. NBC_00649]|uniref:hypothetical protein n=1 Tax=Streptomyces sp. NBC_00649 TaxID=2975798 RepID=UPI0032519A15
MGIATSRRRTDRSRLRLWAVGSVLVPAFAAAVLVAASVFYTAWGLLGAQGLKPEHRIDSTTLFDLVKLSLGVVTGAGALVALIVAYRRQRVDGDGALREATRLHTERFTTAVGQLGDYSAAVRLGGVHALAGVADDAPTHALRQTCIDVLCAYLACPTPPRPTCRPVTRRPGTPTCPCARSGAPSSASSATTSACHPNTPTPGRVTTSTSPKSPPTEETSVSEETWAAFYRATPEEELVPLLANCRGLRRSPRGPAAREPAPRLTESCLAPARRPDSCPQR